VSGDRCDRTERTIRPAGGDVRVREPGDLAAELVVRGHVPERVGGRRGGRLRGPVEEGGDRSALDRGGGAEGAVVPALDDLLLVRPGDLLVEGPAGRHVRERRGLRRRER